MTCPNCTNSDTRMMEVIGPGGLVLCRVCSKTFTQGKVPPPPVQRGNSRPDESD